MPNTGCASSKSNTNTSVLVEFSQQWNDILNIAILSKEAQKKHVLDSSKKKRKQVHLLFHKTI